MMQYTKKKEGKKECYNMSCSYSANFFFFLIHKASFCQKKVSHIFNRILGLVYVEDFQTSLYCSTKSR